MSKCDDLLDLAKRNPRGLRFGDVCSLAECWGFKLRRQRGGHVLYKRSGFPQQMNFQNDRGMAKEYQVKQLLRAIDEIEQVENPE